MAAVLAIAGPVLGIAGSLGGMFGNDSNNASNVQLPPSWQAPGMNEAAGATLAGIPGQGQYNTFGQSLGQAGQTSQNLFNNPYAAFMQQGAQGAGSMAMTGAGNAFNAGTGLYGQGQNLFQQGQNMFQQGQNLFSLGHDVSQQGASLYPYAQSVMQTGFDPQNELYDRTQHKVQEQTRAGQAARGIATTPYGAGLEDQAMRNFNIDWQNQQLQRQVQGLGAGAGAMNARAGIANTGAGIVNTGAGIVNTGAGVANTGAGMVNMGANITGAAPGQFMQGATYPYASYNTIGQGQMGALNQFGQYGQSASMNPQQGIENYLKYLSMGNQAGGVANQTAQLGLNQANLGFNQNQTMGNQLGQGIFGLGQAMNKYPTPAPQYMTGGYQGPV